jgi:hypothetical protein
MRAIPADQLPSTATGVVRTVSFWERLAKALDAYFAARSKLRVSPMALRRSSRELARCRRLMHSAGAVPADTGFGDRPVAGTRS